MRRYAVKIYSDDVVRPNRYRLVKIPSSSRILNFAILQKSSMKRDAIRVVVVVVVVQIKLRFTVLLLIQV